MKIAVTSGYARSRHAIGVIALLHRAGHEVGLCLNVKMLDRRRIGAYFRQHGAKLFTMVRRRVLSRASGDQLHPEVKYIDAYLRGLGVQQRSLSAVCRTTGTRLVHVSDLSGSASLAALDQLKPDLVVYAGGGILRKPFLDRPAIGTINAHGGPLPQVRGMNAAEWALMLGLPTGATVHFVEPGIDTGPMLFFKPLPVAAGDTVADVRGKGVVAAVEALIEAVKRIAANDVQPQPQMPADGKQYFTMHPLLLEILEERLRQRS